MKAVWIVIGIAAALGLTVAQAQAAVVLTVRAELASGQTGQVNGVNGSEPNVLINVYAYFSGADSSYANDGVFQVQGALRSSSGMMQGNLSFALKDPNFSTNTGSQSGTLQNLDGDGDIDMGGKDANIQGAASGYWISAVAPSGSTAQYAMDSNRVLLGQALFTLTDPNAVSGWATTVSWSWRAKVSGIGSKTDVFYVDGSPLQIPGGDSNFLGADPGVTIRFEPTAEPEPATMAILCLGGVAALFRRRGRKAR